MGLRTVACIGLMCAVLTATAAGQRAGPPPLRLVPESMRGADLYRLYCAACHGHDGQGHGPAASSLKTMPSDLTLIAARNNGLFPRARVEWVLTGSEVVDAHRSGDMP